MSTDIRIIPPASPEVTALAKVCQALAEQSSLDRFEIAVKSRLERGIHDDNDLRTADELQHQCVLGGDAVDEATKPVISELYARHKLAIATVKPWKDRWASMVDSLSRIMLSYKDAKRELVARQQRELEAAAEADRRRKEAQAREALRNGDVATAKAAIEAAAQVVTPVIMDATPVLEHSTDRTVWQAEITNPMDVVKAIASGLIPTSAIREWDITFFKKEAARRGGLPATWTGVRAWQESAQSKRR